MAKNILYLKLVTGESIVATCSQDPNDKESIMVKYPLELHTQNSTMGASVKLAKCIPHIKKNLFSIHSDDIIVMERPTDAIVEYYEEGLAVLKDKYVEKKIRRRNIDMKDQEEQLLAMMEYLANTEITIHWGNNAKKEKSTLCKQ